MKTSGSNGSHKNPAMGPSVDSYFVKKCEFEEIKRLADEKSIAMGLRRAVGMEFKVRLVKKR